MNMKEAHHQQLADALPEGVNWHDPLTPSIAQSICQAALAAVPAQEPIEISKQLREYAADSGYSHNDYADTMLAAASEIERCAARLGASQAQQTAQEPAPTMSQFASKADYEAAIAEPVKQDELKAKLCANMIRYLGATKTQAKAIVDGVFDGEHTINQADLEPVKQESKWMPIETAPKDGTKIIILCSHEESGNTEVVDAWFENSWKRIDYYRNTYWYMTIYKLLGWMPLPLPPVEVKE